MFLKTFKIKLECQGSKLLVVLSHKLNYSKSFIRLSRYWSLCNICSIWRELWPKKNPPYSICCLSAASDKRFNNGLQFVSLLLEGKEVLHNLPDLLFISTPPSSTKIIETISTLVLLMSTAELLLVGFLLFPLKSTYRNVASWLVAAIVNGYFVLSETKLNVAVIKCSQGSFSSEYVHYICMYKCVFLHLFRINTPRKEGGLGAMKIPLVADLTKSISRDYGVLKEDEGIAYRSVRPPRLKF